MLWNKPGLMARHLHHLRQQRCQRPVGQAALIQLELSVLHQFRQRPQQVGDFLRLKPCLMARHLDHLRQQRCQRLVGQAALIQLELSVLHQFRQRPQQVGDFLRLKPG